MRSYFLDVVDAGVSNSFDWMLIIVLGATMLVEAALMLLIKYNSFKKSLLDSVVINIASIGVGYLLIKLAPALFNSYDIMGLFKLLVITILTELIVLYLLNTKKLFIQTLKAGIVINVVTYALFYLFIQLSGR